MIDQKIEIEFKDINSMRYPTVGDYFHNNGVLKFEIADTGDWFYNTMILAHEIIEEALTRKRGLSEQEIMDFDLNFENKREEGNIDEPGFDNDCPYLKEHSFATSVELGMCAMAGVSFKDYDKIVNEL